MSARIRMLKAAFGGDLTNGGRTLLCATLGHPPKDRGTSITEKVGAPGNLLVHSHNGTPADALAMKDRALGVLGERQTYSGPARQSNPAEVRRREEARRKAEAQERAETLRLQRRAHSMWREAIDPADSPVSSYLRSRGLDLPPHIAGAVIRYHPRCPWGEGTAPAMVTLIRAVHTGEPIGIHRTAFDQSGAKIGRKVFGSAAGGAIMLDDFADVGSGLTVGEGVETCLAARQLGLAPVWALISVGNIGALPVLAGVEALTVLGEVDTAPSRPSATAFERVAARWHAEGRAVDLVMPRIGRDMNDVILGREAA